MRQSTRRCSKYVHHARFNLEVEHQSYVKKEKMNKKNEKGKMRVRLFFQLRGGSFCLKSLPPGPGRLPLPVLARYSGWDIININGFRDGTEPKSIQDKGERKFAGFLFLKVKIDRYGLKLALRNKPCLSDRFRQFLLFRGDWKNNLYQLSLSLNFNSPSGRSSVFDGVRTTGNDERCFPPRRKPVDDVSASDMIPGSSSYSIAEDGGG